MEKTKIRRQRKRLSWMDRKSRMGSNMSDRSAKMSAMCHVSAAKGKEKCKWMRTYELTNGDLLRKIALWASRIFPVVVVVLADPEKLGE